MTFAERLIASGFRTRYRRVEVPFTLRAEDEIEDEGEIEDEIEDEGDGDGLTLRGLAVPFNSVTRIRSFFDEFDEQFLPGSMKRTIGQGHQVMMFEHGEHPLLGSIPIASISRLEEVEKPKPGLEVTARMFDNWMTEPLQEPIRSGAINGMSIQFRPIKETIDEREDDVPLVSVVDADLRELGPVIFPAYEDTSVTLRKEFTESVRRSVEAALRAAAESPTGGATNHELVGPGSTHPTNRKRLGLAQARLTIVEIT